MTNLEAIKSTVVGYPVEENTFLRILVDRGINSTENYTGKSKMFELAYADVLTSMLAAANVAEGDLQVSMTDKSNFMKVASGIYDKYSEPNPFNSQPTVQGSSPW